MMMDWSVVGGRGKVELPADPGNAVFLCLRQEQKFMNVIHVLFF
jgi:hypothetical protein